MLAIIVEEKSKTFHLQMDNSSYIFQVMENGELEQLYYGKKVHARSQYPNLIIREQKTATVAWRQDRPDIQPDVLKQEYSSFGKGDFRYPAYQLIMKDGSRISEFVYNSYEKFNGKKRLPDLPSTFDDVSDDSETLFTAISKIIEETKLDYVKWDMNRHITEMFSIELSAETQLEMPHRYILGVYRLYERLTKAYPKILFESCSSGGGRFDLGMMYYAPQAWTSDDTDAVERMFIQFGTSYGYPQSMMGAHVSAVPNEQTGRITSLDTRAAVAFLGILGYELDITKLSSEETVEIAEQIKFYKRYRHLFQFGKLYRIESPFNNKKNVMSWQVVSANRQQSIGCWYQILNHPSSSYEKIYFKGLSDNKMYKVNDSGNSFYGDELMNAGLFIHQLTKLRKDIKVSNDFQAILFVLEAVN
jgi:alpha-galactosidase